MGFWGFGVNVRDALKRYGFVAKSAKSRLEKVAEWQSYDQNSGAVPTSKVLELINASSKSIPMKILADFGDKEYFVNDQRGYSILL